MGTIFKKHNEKDMLLKQMWEIVLRETAVEGKEIDDAGCDWFTRGNTTYIGDTEWVVSYSQEVADLVNAINALSGNTEFINKVENSNE